MDDIAAEPVSTQIDPTPTPSAAGGGQMALSEPVKAEPAKPEAPKAPRSSRDDLADALKEQSTKDAPKPAKPETKVNDAERPADDADKQEAPDEESKSDKPAEKPEGKRPEAPKNFLPKAKEMWRSTPREVQSEVDRVLRENETLLAERTQQTERYESIREYDDLARQNGRELKDSLATMHRIENLMAQSPLAGLNAILMEIGPRKSDGQPLSLWDIAEHLGQMGPQGYQQIMQQAAQSPRQEPEGNAELQQLREQIKRMEMAQSADKIIEPFRAANPRYDELHDDIALFLESGKIPATLSPIERLSAAYDMAERINPPSHIDPPEPDAGLGSRRADDGFSGMKSIKSTPGSVSERTEYQARPGESTSDSLRAELRRMRRP